MDWLTALCLSLPLAAAIVEAVRKYGAIFGSIRLTEATIAAERLKWEKEQAKPPPDPEETAVSEAQVQIDDWLAESPDAAGFDENQQEHARWAYLVLAGEVQGTHNDKASARAMLERWGAPRPD